MPYVEFPAEIDPLAGAMMAGHGALQISGISEGVVLALANELGEAQTGKVAVPMLLV